MKLLPILLTVLACGCAVFNRTATKVSDGWHYDSTLPKNWKWDASHEQYNILDEHGIVTNNADGNKVLIGK